MSHIHLEKVKPITVMDFSFLPPWNVKSWLMEKRGVIGKFCTQEDSFLAIRFKNVTVSIIIALKTAMTSVVISDKPNFCICVIYMPANRLYGYHYYYSYGCYYTTHYLLYYCPVWQSEANYIDDATVYLWGSFATWMMHSCLLIWLKKPAVFTCQSFIVACQFCQNILWLLMHLEFCVSQFQRHEEMRGSFSFL